MRNFEKNNEVEMFINVLNKNKHHKVKLLEKIPQMIKQHYFKNIKAKSERDKIRTANRTFFIKGFDYILAYRVLYYGKKVRFTGVGVMEHRTPTGIIYENLHSSFNKYTNEPLRVIHLSHYFDRLTQRNNTSETRYEAIKRYLNDELLVTYCFELKQDEFFDSKKRCVDFNNEKDIEETTFYSDNGLGLGVHYTKENLIVIKTFISEEMLRNDDQQQRFIFYQNFKKQLPSIFKNVKEIENIAKTIKEKEKTTLQIEI